MEPTTILALLQGAGLFGGALGLGGRRDRSTEKLLQMLYAYTSPEAITGAANKYYQAYLQSPAYSQGLRAVTSGANRAASDVAGSLAFRGMTGSGVGALFSGLGSNTAGFKLADLQSGAWQNALKIASDVASQRFANAGYLKGPRDVGLDVGAGLLDWLGRLDPKMFSGTPKVKTASTVGSYNPRPQDAAVNWAQLAGRIR